MSDQTDKPYCGELEDEDVDDDADARWQEAVLKLIQERRNAESGE